MPDGAMRGDPGVLDEAYDRLARTDFELPNGFVNHGPMAVEALDALGLDGQVDGWARRMVGMIGEGPEPAAPASLGSGAWREGLGDYRLLPEWIGLFDRDVGEWGWATVVEVWVPRLMPALSTALFHGAIRTARRAGGGYGRHAGPPVRTGPIARLLGRPLPPRPRPGDGRSGRAGGRPPARRRRRRSPPLRGRAHHLRPARGNRGHGRAPPRPSPGTRSRHRGVGPAAGRPCRPLRRRTSAGLRRAGRLGGRSATCRRREPRSPPGEAGGGMPTRSEAAGDPAFPRSGPDGDGAIAATGGSRRPLSRPSQRGPTGEPPQWLLPAAGGAVGGGVPRAVRLGQVQGAGSPSPRKSPAAAEVPERASAASTTAAAVYVVRSRPGTTPAPGRPCRSSRSRRAVASLGRPRRDPGLVRPCPARREP